MKPRSILVIRHGALGDLVQSFAPFEAIRAYAPKARITLLTTQPYADFARVMPWFDAVMSDERPRLHQPRALWRLARLLRRADLVVDLQTSGRTSRYHRLAGGAPWSGHAARAIFPHDNPWRDAMHTRARQADQLRRAGIAPIDRADLRWIGTSPRPDGAYAVLAPGAAAHRAAKRWPVARFGEVARLLVGAGLLPVIVGTRGEVSLAAEIRAMCPQTEDWTGRTSLLELAGLLKGARCVIGNDTGPLHLAAELGVRAVVLFSGASDPALTAPVGRAFGQVSILQASSLEAISANRVAALVL